MVVLIHGRGVVRAGQWARRLIMNESLDRGSQLPYLRECSKRGWGVLVMNTNHNTFIDRDGRQRTFEVGTSYCKVLFYFMTNLLAKKK
uniref:DUF4258 domain-containing protein n=1 Tax=Ascaris lumbricoides TaxID=6252 RepID=A0A0M3IVV6_ASCLU